MDAKDTSSILYPAKVVGSAAAATVQLSVQRFSHVPLPDSVPSGAEGTSTHVATALLMVVQDAVTAVTAVTPVEAATPVTSGSSWQFSVSARVTTAAVVPVVTVVEVQLSGVAGRFTDIQVASQYVGDAAVSAMAPAIALHVVLSELASPSK